MLPELHSDRQLAAIEASSVPHMSSQGHRDTIGRHTRMLGREARPKRATAADLAAIGITVTTVTEQEGSTDGG